VFNTKVVPNILIHLWNFFYIFLRSIIIFLKHLSVSALNRNSIQSFSNIFSLRARPDRYRPEPSTHRVAHRAVAAAFPPIHRRASLWAHPVHTRCQRESRIDRSRQHRPSILHWPPTPALSKRGFLRHVGHSRTLATAITC
jgi:hypothetical protein